MQKPLGRNTVVLLGVGHTNAYTLRMWKMQPIANAQLICVSNFPVAAYSGMLPGVLSGQFPPEKMEIDLVRLCASAGARLIVAEVTGLDCEQHRLEFANRPPLGFDVLSIGIGSKPSFENTRIESERILVPIKPMQTFLARLNSVLELPTNRHRQDDSSAAGKKDSQRIVIVGGGVGSIEIAFCLEQRLTNWSAKGLPNHARDRPIEITLVTASDKIGNQLLDSTQQKIQRQLGLRNIRLITGQRVTTVLEDGLVLSDGSTLPADAILWATGAAPPALLTKLRLATDAAGFIATRPTLQSTTDDHVFAVGDSASIVESQIPKAGVYAVRQGPVLWNNINRLLTSSSPLESYDPQAGFLKLINTGDGKSIAEYRGYSFQTAWAWKLKKRIDDKFMAMYQDYRPMEMALPEPESNQAMRCLGCGGKIGSELLGHVLDDLKIPSHDDVIIGLEHPDDAAVIRTHDNRVTVTTDFFASPMDDPYLVGRIALLNSASDCFVMGAQPTAALAMVQLPAGHPRSQLRCMQELMAGSVEELAKMGATIVGGHTIEGPQLTIGFTILGRQLTDPKTKGQLKSGDRLILTKPLGTGVLLAALMRCLLPGAAYSALIQTMLQSNQIALRLAQEFQISGITDVTGFGFAGHLAEMLTASHLSANLQLDRLPKLIGSQTLLDAGLESTLAPDNRLVSQKVDLQIDDLNSARNAILFDPQTGGGLLFGVSERRAENVLSFLRSEGFNDAMMVGEVFPCVTAKPMLKIL